jgi:predicted ATPase
VGEIDQPARNRRVIVTLALYTLGPFLARFEQGRELTLTSAKAQALLAYLAIERGRRHHREALAGLLWPSQSSESARGSLRQALQVLRQALGDRATSRPYLLVTRDTIQFNPTADFWLDVAALEELAAQLSGRSADDEQTMCKTLQVAIDLYRGPFLQEFAVDDSPAYEEWLLLKREQLHRQVLQTLATSAASCEQGRHYAQALTCVRRLIELEPWQEEAHRQAMRLLTLLGRRAEAVAQYRQCRELLLRELEVEPGPETTALYERIREGASVAWTPAPSPPAPDLGLPLLAPAVQAEAPPLLVAREQELARLETFLATALAGEGRIVLITGEAGSGKTALATGFARRALSARPGLLAVLGRCSAHSGAGDPYQPFREVLRTLAGDPEVVLSAEQARRLRAALPTTLEALVQCGPDLALLLTRDPALLERARACAPRGAAWLTRLEALLAQAEQSVTPVMQQAALCEQMTRVLRAIAPRLALLLVFDDLQWADAFTLDLLSYLARHLQGSRILIVGTLRPDSPGMQPTEGQAALGWLTAELQRQWGDIRLDLARAQGRRFVDAYLDSWPNRLQARFREALAHHTGGNALFTVELVRAMQDRGDLRRDGEGRWVETSALAWEQAPPRVEGAISQRIGELTVAQRRLLTVASVEGDEFHVEVLAAVLGQSPQGVIAELSGPLSRQAHLVMPAGLVRVGDRQLARYRFRHGLFQSHLYERLDEASRAQLHGEVGAAIETLYGEQVDHLAIRLAYDFEVAGLASRAAVYLLKAGSQAERVAAISEAVTCYERALVLLADLPVNSERIALEFALYMALDHALLFALGWSAPERLTAANRAYELARQMSPGVELLRALRALAELSAARGELARAIALADELLQAAERQGDLLYTASAHAIIGMSLARRGELRPAWEHIMPALDFCLHPPYGLTAEEKQSFSPHTQVTAAFLLTIGGQLDRARRQIERFLSQDWRDTPQAAGMHSLAAIVYAQAHLDGPAREQAQEALRIVGERQLPEVQAWGEGALHWVRARAGRSNDADIDAAPRAPDVQAFLAQPALSFHFVQVMLQAEAQLVAGQPDRVIEMVDQALAQVEATTARYAEAELWRLRGEALLHQDRSAGDDADQATACFQRAIDVARQQGALLWELRATMSLAQVWARQGLALQGRAALATVYAAFTEGFDAPDLVEARALLDSLARPDRPVQCGGLPYVPDSVQGTA